MNTPCRNCGEFFPNHEPGTTACPQKFFYTPQPQKRGQTWWGSIVEAKANIAVGFGVAMAANAVVLPAFGYPVTVADNLGITVVFTVISVVRQLIVRRFFNNLKWGHHK